MKDGAPKFDGFLHLKSKFLRFRLLRLKNSIKLLKNRKRNKSVFNANIFVGGYFGAKLAIPYRRNRSDVFPVSFSLPFSPVCTRGSERKSYLRTTMHPKYIIAGDPHTGKGYLRMGIVINHKDLVVGLEKVWGGGWWTRDDQKKTITLYGSSCDFGSADFRHLKLIDRELEGYTFIYTPIMNLPGNVLDLSDVEWI